MQGTEPRVRNVDDSIVKQRPAAVRINIQILFSDGWHVLHSTAVASGGESESCSNRKWIGRTKAVTGTKDGRLDNRRATLPAAVFHPDFISLAVTVTHPRCDLAVSVVIDELGAHPPRSLPKTHACLLQQPRWIRTDESTETRFSTNKPRTNRHV